MSNKISINEEQDKAKNTPLRKGMIVRALPLAGSWGVLAGAEFYVLSDEAEAVWGHPMAIRHLFDVDPEDASILSVAKDEKGVPLFYYIYLPEDCVEVLEQDTWTNTDEESFSAVDRWKSEWKWMAKEDERRRQKYEKTNPQLTNIFDPDRWNWERTWNNRSKLFTPDLIDKWVDSEE